MHYLLKDFYRVNLIDKETLRGNQFDEEYTWRARLFLFLGFAFMAGGFSGSVVCIMRYLNMISYDTNRN